MTNKQESYNNLSSKMNGPFGEGEKMGSSAHKSAMELVEGDLVEGKGNGSTKVKESGGKEDAAICDVLGTAGSRLWQHTELRRMILLDLHRPTKNEYLDRELCDLMTLDKATFHEISTIVYAFVDNDNWMLRGEGLLDFLRGAGATRERISYYAEKVSKLHVDGRFHNISDVLSSTLFMEFPKLAMITAPISFVTSAGERWDGYGDDSFAGRSTAVLGINRDGSVEISCILVEEARPGPPRRRVSDFGWLARDSLLRTGTSFPTKITKFHVKEMWSHLRPSKLLDFFDPMCNKLTDVTFALTHLNIQQSASIDPSDLSRLTLAIPGIRSLKFDATRDYETIHLEHLVQRCPNLHTLNIRSSEWKLTLVDVLDVLAKRLPRIAKLAVPLDVSKARLAIGGKVSLLDRPSESVPYPNLVKLKLHLVPISPHKDCHPMLHLAHWLEGLVGEYCRVKVEAKAESKGTASNGYGNHRGRRHGYDYEYDDSRSPSRSHSPDSRRHCDPSCREKEAEMRMRLAEKEFAAAQEVLYDLREFRIEKEVVQKRLGWRQITRSE